MITTAQPRSLLDTMFATFTTGLEPRGQARQTGPWQQFLPRLFPSIFQSGFGEHHEQFWTWVWDMEPGVRPAPFVGIWPRGGAKSTSAEASAVAVGARHSRNFILYISATQKQANDHVAAIRTLLEHISVQSEYPELSSRLENYYGQSRGWRMDRIRTASGLSVVALGLDTAARGIKMDSLRPDMIVLDDIDEEDDTTEATQKKIDTITRKILPAGSDDAAVLAIQNLVLTDGVFARLAGLAAESAGFLADRYVSGPVPAVIDAEYEEHGDDRGRIIAGTATWPGMDLDACNRLIKSEGLNSFRIERQHEVRERGDKIHKPEWWDRETGRARYNFHDPTWERIAISRIQHWDTAWEAKTSSAYSACVTLDLIPWNHGYAALVRDVWRGRIPFSSELSLDLLDAIVEQAEKWELDRSWPLPSEVIVEYAASGKAAVQDLAHSAPEWLQPKIGRYTPKLSKDQRQVNAAKPSRAGRVWLPYPHVDLPWLTPFEKELYAVPGSTYRDSTDAFAQGVDWWTNYLGSPATSNEEEDPDGNG